ncbi:MAG: mitochondrial ribosomal small subunit component [Alyxoria varia]|nr:MAG: mitochondrial ribosomal small subunit component [Alyxoria varia]
MGRHDLRPVRVHDTATLLMKTKRSSAPPPWYKAMTEYPPTQALVRPQPVSHTNHNVRLRPQRKYKKPSKMFMPQPITYMEDKLRQEFFGDHPWELARPRILLENDGKDYQRWDWSKPSQPGRPVDGESVVQRQMWLMEHERPDPKKPTTMKKAAAYDKARKEFYDLRHFDEIETRIAKEEAQSYGADFGKSAQEVGMQLEGEQFEKFKIWAREQVTLVEQSRSAAYTGFASPTKNKEEVEPKQESEGVEAALSELAVDNDEQ